MRAEHGFPREVREDMKRTTAIPLIVLFTCVYVAFVAIRNYLEMSIAEVTIKIKRYS
ncbi:hypothetical protein [Shouchella patagoniensis]|uniref:hypothetical protein n=1 Tax=Shouchella patagoniensis TaxID=228576 RepID=UPI00147491C6|nr:hypothetical protein [Shouchella patagoniensis]